jgi:hypoxanthine phosphoribosyltransferase
MSENLSQQFPRVLLPAEQIQQRVQEMARQIARDFEGKTIYLVGVMENSFMFMADLVRQMDVPVVCQFVTGVFTESTPSTTEIFYTPEVDVRGQHVLLVELVIQSGHTSDFLMRNLMGRGAASVKLAVLLDKQASRRISLQPDYFGFLMNENFVVGYGLGNPHIGRNLPYIAAKAATSTNG